MTRMPYLYPVVLQGDAFAIEGLPVAGVGPEEPAGGRQDGLESPLPAQPAQPIQIARPASPTADEAGTAGGADETGPQARPAPAAR